MTKKIQLQKESESKEQFQKSKKAKAKNNLSSFVSLTSKEQKQKSLSRDPKQPIESLLFAHRQPNLKKHLKINKANF